MQQVKRQFHEMSGGRHGSLQSCIRTDDIEYVGDGSHLTYFEMLGNFSFGGNDYEVSVELWHSILSDLGIKNCYVKVHPSELSHHNLWKRRGYHVEPDEDCVWSDGSIGGFCCEIFVDDLEIGNLVNPMGHSTDVGFGWERLHQIIEGKKRVDQTSLFNHNVPPIVSDHLRSVGMMWKNDIQPGNKGRNYICRRLIRRMLRLLDESDNLPFSDWIRNEIELREKSLRQGRRYWRRHQNKPPSFWWETFGVLPDEIKLLK